MNRLKTVTHQSAAGIVHKSGVHLNVENSSQKNGLSVNATTVEIVSKNS